MSLFPSGRSFSASSIPLRQPATGALMASAGFIASQSQEFRWAKADLPLLWNAPDFESALLEEVMAEWSEASQGKIAFEAAHYAQSARLHFEWIDRTTLGRDYEVGHTNRQVQGGQILQAQISMIRNPAIDRHLSIGQQKQRFRTTLLHEIGHALGVEHSNSPTDVMYYQGWRNEHLSKNDTQRLLFLYR
jgi:predicted Zn-dependent protease